MLIASNVDGSAGTMTVPAAVKLPSGATFRLNFVKSATETNTILAQSDQFVIVNLSDFGFSSGVLTATTSLRAVPTSTRYAFLFI